MVPHEEQKSFLSRMIDPSSLALQEPEMVFRSLETSEGGLSEEEADRRLQHFGENAIKKEKGFRPFKILLAKLFSVFSVMLWIASILAYISGTPILTYVIWSIVLINSIFSYIQESKADKALQSLSKMMPNNVKVYRNGELSVKPADSLVPGDTVALAAGDKVPADIRIISADGLFVDNSMLTGESVPVDRNEKPAKRGEGSIIECENLVFAGTMVTGGSATGIVFATGSATQIGNISSSTAEIETQKSSLEIQIERITKIVAIIAVVIGIITFLLSVFVTELKVSAALLFAIGIIVANIPEGLMPTVSLSLALSVVRMAKKKALMRKQSAVETLSATSVICTDKTGTLTRNEMFTKAIWTADGVAEFGGEGFSKQGSITGKGASGKALSLLLTASAVCSDTVLKSNGDQWEIIGNPTEGAVLIAAEKAGLDIAAVRKQFEQKQLFPFSSETKKMTVHMLNKQCEFFPESHVIEFTKGNPANLIAESDFILKDGAPSVMTESKRAEIKEINNKAASEGYRVLAIAFRDITAQQGLTLLGLAIMYDPPKEGVKEAVADCYRAGLKVTIVTGDYSLTAAAIAKQVGIVQDQYVAIDGPELERMTKEELAMKIDTEQPVIFARTTPKHKLKIVETYQSIGHVVAVTGDGINDVLALKKADIGISMGEKGSDVAIEASDMVLLDDHFATIVEAIKEGRAIYANIQKFLTYILASNIPEVLPFLVMGIFNIPLAMTVLLVLAIDLGTDLLPAISLGAELPEDDILDKPPRDPNSNILNKSVLLRAYSFLGLLEAAMLFLFFFFAWNHFGYTFEEIRGFTASIAEGTAAEDVMHVYSYAITLGFGAVIAAQIGNLLSCRSSYLSIFQTFKKNNLMIWGIAVELLFYLMIAYVPAVQNLLGTTGPEWIHLAMLPASLLVFLIFEETRKLFVRKMGVKIA